jgi:DnaJ-class molecular chaperone
MAKRRRVCKKCAGNGQTVKFKSFCCSINNKAEKLVWARIATPCKSCKGLGYKD